MLFYSRLKIRDKTLVCMDFVAKTVKIKTLGSMAFYSVQGHSCEVL